MKLRICCFIMSLVLLSGCAGNIKDNIFMGIGAYSILARARETRKRHKEARESRTYKEQHSASISSQGVTESGGASAAGIITPDIFQQIFQEGREDFKRFRYRNCQEKMVSASAATDSLELKAQALFYAGACSFYLGRREEAEKYFTQARSLFPAFVPNVNIFTPALIKVYGKCGK